MKNNQHDKPMTLQLNSDKIVEMLLQCQPCQPVTRGTYQVDHEGTPFLLPSTGGITLNVKVGDSVFGLAGDHIEPGVSCCSNPAEKKEFPNNSLNMYSCIGNKAVIASGKAEGVEGVVTGKHGGVEHVLIDFPSEAMSRMTYDDTIIIHSKGQGLALGDFPEIKLFNIDPDLFLAMNIVVKKGRIHVPVTTRAPAVCMGSGVGSPHVATGDYDIMTSDQRTVEKYRLDAIRFGDIVALLDHDNAYGRAYKKGAVSIGVIVHSDCLKAGHGPGVTTLMTCSKNLIKPVVTPEANIADILNIGRRRD